MKYKWFFWMILAFTCSCSRSYDVVDEKEPCADGKCIEDRCCVQDFDSGREIKVR